jgi:hypothetical protein
MDQNTPLPQVEDVPASPIEPVKVPQPTEPVVPQVTPPPEPASPPVDQVKIEPKKGSSITKVALIFFLVAVFVAAGYFLWTKYFSGSKVEITPSPIVVATSFPTPDPTADWKIYTSKIFSFKYPVSWDTYIIGENTASTLMVAPLERVNSMKQTEAMGGSNILTLTITTKPDAPTWKTDEYWQVISEPISVGDIDGTKYTINVIQDLPGFSKGDTITSVVIKNESTYFQIDLLDQAYVEIYDQILSTVNFEESTPSANL